MKTSFTDDHGVHCLFKLLVALILDPWYNKASGRPADTAILDFMSVSATRLLCSSTVHIIAGHTLMSSFNHKTSTS